MSGTVIPQGKFTMQRRHRIEKNILVFYQTMSSPVTGTRQK